MSSLYPAGFFSSLKPAWTAPPPHLTTNGDDREQPWIPRTTLWDRKYFLHVLYQQT